MAEKVEGFLENYSSILIQEYIRLMSVATCIKKENNSAKTHFKMSKDLYNRLYEDKLKAPLIGINIDYSPEDEIITTSINTQVADLYKNAIMRGVALKFSEDYKNRYNNFIQIMD